MPKSTTEEHEQRTETLRQALIQGEKSGVAGPLDMDKIKRQCRADPSAPRS